MKKCRTGYAVLTALFTLPAAHLAAQAPAAAPPVDAPATPPVAAPAISRVPADAPPPHTPIAGPYKVEIVDDPSLPDFTIFRPQAAKGKTRALPVVAWGNGGCADDNVNYRGFLSTVASHGFVIIAPGPLKPKSERGTTKGTVMQTALNWAESNTAKKDSPWFNRFDLGRMALMGYSCGGLQAIENAGDKRVKSVVIISSGTFPGAEPRSQFSTATKADLERLHTPVIYLIGGPVDVAFVNAEDDYARIKVPIFKGNINAGHLNTIRHPGGGWFAEASSKWLRWTLDGDKAAGKYFSGKACTLCVNPVWKVERKGL